MRPIGVVFGVALAGVLCCGIGVASPFPAVTRPDIGSQLMLRLFGETSDGRASVEAAFGNRISESPLRAAALEISGPADDVGPSELVAASVPVAATPDSGAGGLADLTRPADVALFSGPVRFSMDTTDRDGATLAPNTLLTATYQPVVPAPNISPEPGTLAFGDAAQGLAALHNAVQTPSFATPPLQVGNVQFQGNVSGSSTVSPQLSLRSTNYGAGADFNVRAGSRELSVDLGTQYEHVSRSDPTGFSASTLDSAAWQLPSANAPLVIPNYANLSRLSVGAGLAVPLVHGLTLNLNYDAGHLFGGYGLPGLTNLDAINNSYGGRLTFDIPGSFSKSLSVSAYQERFSGNALPLGGSTQLREDVNFTVKF